jgi:hypothetical protein
MAALALKLTDAGLAAVQGASGSDPVVLSHLGLTNTPFDYAPTLVALPGEFKRLEVAAGVAAAANITHLTAYDTSADDWSITGFGIFMADGILFAVYTSADIIMNKAQLAFGLLAFDIAFDGDLAANISYGNAVFAYPPATLQYRGVARLARQERVNAAADGEDDDETIVTPKTLRARLAAFTASVTASVEALSTSLSNGLNSLSTSIDNGLESLRQRRITGGGLVTGGGDLYADRVLTVTEADPEDITAGTSATKVITPRRLGPITMLLQQNGFIRFFGFQMAWGRFNAAANATTPVVFVQAFANACFSAVCSGVTNLGTGSNDNTAGVVASTITAEGFTAFSADNEPNITCYIAVGY